MIDLSMNSCGKTFHIVHKTVFQQSNVGQLWRVFLTVFQHCVPYTIIQWLFHPVHLLLFFYIKVAV